MLKGIVVLLVYLIFSNQIVFANNNEPNVKAQGAILLDAKTGRVLWGKNIDEPLAMASTTKIMTAILAIENGNLEDIVKVSKKASLTPPVKMFLKEGEEIKLKYLLYALMMQSSNDAATAIAEHISGTVEKFCQLMTEKAKSLGAKDTIFETPNGLDSGEHHSTAYDMAIIARYALKNKTFLEIINTRQISFKSNKSSYNIINKNRLLAEFNGATGVKTGYTGKAGHCFVGSAKRGDMELISVVLASGWGNAGKNQKWVDTKSILNYGFDNFKYEKVIEKDILSEKLKINKGEKEDINIYYKNSLEIPLKQGEKDKIIVKNELPEIVEAPIYENQKIGVANLYLGNEKIGSVEILAKEATARKTIISNLKKIIKNWLNILVV